MRAPGTCAGAAPFPWRRVSPSRPAQSLRARRVPQSLRVLLGPAGGQGGSPTACVPFDRLRWSLPASPLRPPSPL